MDYGHATQTDNSSPSDFFTAGAGTQSTEDNTFESKNNLDMGNSVWGNTQPQANHDVRSIGANGLTSHELNHASPYPRADSLQRAPGKQPEIGQIVNLEMPPSASRNTEFQDSETPSLEGLFSGDKLTEKGLSLINEEENKFRQGGESISDFYDEITKMREASQSLGGGE